MALSYNLGYQESISVHPTRRQNFAGKVYSNFLNIWEWLVYRVIISKVGCQLWRWEGYIAQKTAHHCRNSLLAFVIAFSYEIVFVFSPFPAFPGEIGHIHVAIPYVHSIGATVGHHIRPWEAKIEYQTYFKFSLHWSNKNANLLKFLHRCVRRKMIMSIPQGGKESWRLQQTGGPLSESFQGDLILLNNAAVHRAHKSRSIGPVHLLVESCDGVIGRLFYCSGWRRVD